MDAETKQMKAEIRLLTAKVAALVGSLDTPQVARWKRMHEGVCYSMKIDPITGESLDGLAPLARPAQTERATP